MPSRRSILVGLGGLVAGGGALIGTGAFTTVEAQRTVSVQTTDDSGAFLGLAPADRNDSAGDTQNAYVSETTGDGSSGTIEINLDGTGDNSEASGLNRNARTTFRELVALSNNGTQTVTSLTLEFTQTPNGVDPADTFSFTVDDANQGSDTISHPDDSAAELLTGNTQTTMTSGETISIGLEIDLLDGGDSNNELPAEGSYTLTITADTEEDN